MCDDYDVTLEKKRLAFEFPKRGMLCIWECVCVMLTQSKKKKESINFGCLPEAFFLNSQSPFEFLLHASLSLYFH